MKKRPPREKDVSITEKPNMLFSKIQRFHDGSVPFDVVVFQIGQKTTTLPDQTKQGTLRVVVVLVLSQMIGQMIDTV